MTGRRILLLSLSLTAAAVAGATDAANTSQPDVFLVTIDTLRADHISCYGYDRIQTPSLDALARDGIRFSEAFTPSPITNTSHATILTGLLPSVHGVTDFAIPLAPSHPTWAELLKKKGYRTAAFIGAITLDSKTLAPGLDRGFDFYHNFPEHPRSKSRWGRVERRGMDVVRNAEIWLNAHRSGPRFVWVHLFDPHDPYEPPPPYSQIYKDNLYDGEIAYADFALGKFFAYLKKQDWYVNSLIIVVGDHGEGLGEHGEETHGIFLYDSTTHVPLIMKTPGKTQVAKVVNAQVRTTDVLPTTLDLLGVSPPARLDGESLKPYLASLSAKGRIAYGETDYPLRFGWAPLRTVRDDGFKFIEAPRPELYDLHADPGELKNVYEPWNTNVEKFRGMLAHLKSELPPTAPSAAAVNSSTLDELQALGYLSPADAQSSTNVPEPSLLPDPKDKIQEHNLLHTAMISAEDNRSAEARTALEKVLELNPRSPTALFLLGELELQSAYYTKAADYLGRALAIRPVDTLAAYHQGQALNKTGDLVGARDALEASLKLTPGQFPARLLLGRVYLRLKDPKAAEDQFEAALLLEPKSFDAKLDLAKAHIASGSFQDAVQRLEPLAGSQPDNAEVVDLLSQAYSGLGKKAEARQAETRAQFLRASSKKPKDPRENKSRE